MPHQKKGKVLVYNKAFFQTSQTFMYHQVRSLEQIYNVILLAEKFENPHKFDTDSFSKVRIKPPRLLPGRILSKYVRTKYDTMFHVDIPSYTRFIRIFKKGDLKVIHVHFGTNAVKLLPFAKKYDVPLVVTFHGYDASQALSDEKYRKKLPELFQYASAIIIVSSHMMNTLKLDMWKDKVHRIPCSVNPDEFQAKVENNSGKVRILHSGRLTGKKGVPDLIRVFQNLSAMHDNIELHIVGNGEDMKECQRLADKYKLNETVTFHGAVSHTKVKEIMRTADIFVLNSRVDEKGDMEGTPVSLLEAMSSNVPVISTYHAGIPDVVENEKNGLLVPEKDNAALQKALNVLIKDPGLRKQYAETARKTVKNEYTIEHMKQKLVDVFKTI